MSNKTDSMIRIDRDTSKKLSVVAANKGMTKKEYLKRHADKEYAKIK